MQHLLHNPYEKTEASRVRPRQQCVPGPATTHDLCRCVELSGLDNASKQHEHDKPRPVVGSLLSAPRLSSDHQLPGVPFHAQLKL